MVTPGPETKEKVKVYLCLSVVTCPAAIHKTVLLDVGGKGERVKEEEIKERIWQLLKAGKINE